MIDNNKIIEEAKIYLNSNLTMSETAEKIGISKRTLQLHILKLEDINAVLYRQVLEKKAANQEAGRKAGGLIGKREKIHTKEEVIEFANMMINEQLSYDELASITSIPKSTLWELMHSDYIDGETNNKLDLVAKANRRNKSVSEVIRGATRK